MTDTVDWRDECCVETEPEAPLSDAERKRLKRQEKNRRSAAKSRQRISETARRTRDQLDQSLLLVQEQQTLNRQLAAENARLRAAGEQLAAENARLSAEIASESHREAPVSLKLIQELTAENARLSVEVDLLKSPIFFPDFPLDG